MIVRIVATSSPPMIVAAIPPNMGSGRSGVIPSMVVAAAMPTGTALETAAVTTAS